MEQKLAGFVLGIDINSQICIRYSKANIIAHLLDTERGDIYCKTFCAIVRRLLVRESFLIPLVLSRGRCKGPVQGILKGEVSLYH